MTCLGPINRLIAINISLTYEFVALVENRYYEPDEALAGVYASARAFPYCALTMILAYLAPHLVIIYQVWWKAVKWRSSVRPPQEFVR